MTGEEPGADISEGDKGVSFTEKPLGKKALIVAAGPFFNFFLAIVIFYLLYQISGVWMARPDVGKVVENSPAQAAGIRPGDVLTQVNGSPVKAFEDIFEAVGASQGNPIEVVVLREGAQKSFQITPQRQDDKNVFGEPVDRYVIGIVGTGETFHMPLNFFQAAGRSLSDTWDLVKLTLLSFVKMVSGRISADNLGGPIMIAQMAGEQARAGMVNFVWFIALLSVNLGIINLFPFLFWMAVIFFSSPLKL